MIFFGYVALWVFREGQKRMLRKAKKRTPEVVNSRPSISVSHLKKIRPQETVRVNRFFVNE